MLLSQYRKTSRIGINISDSCLCYVNCLSQYTVLCKTGISYSRFFIPILPYKYIDMPDVIRFNKYLKENNHVFDNYIEMKELLKAIFRDVENK